MAENAVFEVRLADGEEFQVFLQSLGSLVAVLTSVREELPQPLRDRLDVALLQVQGACQAMEAR